MTKNEKKLKVIILIRTLLSHLYLMSNARVKGEREKIYEILSFVYIYYSRLLLLKL